MLLSSKSANIPKVEVLIVMKDQVWELHELKADVLDKSQPKRWPSVRRLPELCPFETRPCLLAAAASI